MIPGQAQTEDRVCYYDTAMTTARTNKRGIDLTRKSSAAAGGSELAAEFNVQVIEKLIIGTTSGWLKRLVRSVGIYVTSG